MLLCVLLLVCCVIPANSFLLAIFLFLPLAVILSDNFLFRALPCFLSVQNIVQSSSVLGSSYCSVNISEEKESSTSLQLFLGAFPLHFRGIPWPGWHEIWKWIEGKRKRAFLKMILLPLHVVDPAVVKLDCSFPCVVELVIHLLKCFLLDHSPNKLWIPYPLVSTLLRASEP